jgi:hypothetical protein
MFATVAIAVCCLLALERSWVLEAQCESRIATRLERLGARVFYCWRLDAGIIVRSSTNKSPQWLIPGDVIIMRVNLTSCCDPELDQELACLGSLRNLRGLDLAGSSLANAGLQHVSGVMSLELLNLGGTNIGDDGIRHLTACPRLTSLYLCNTSLSDACVPYLASLKHLKWISVRGTRITPSGIAQLREQSPALWIVSDHDRNSWSRPFHDSPCGSSESRSLTSNRFAATHKKSRYIGPKMDW